MARGASRTSALAPCAAGVAGAAPLLTRARARAPDRGADEDFSARVDAMNEVPRLPARQLAAPAPRVAAMRRALHAAAPAFSWDARAGGLAYNYTLLALCLRAVELRGRLRGGDASCKRISERLPLAASERTRTPAWFPPGLVEATQRAVQLRREAVVVTEVVARAAAVGSHV